MNMEKGVRVLAGQGQVQSSKVGGGESRKQLKVSPSQNLCLVLALAMPGWLRCVYFHGPWRRMAAKCVRDWNGVCGNFNTSAHSLIFPPKSCTLIHLPSNKGRP